MVTKEKILDDMARMAGSAVGTLGNLSAQVKEEIRTRVDEAALRMDLVPRAEFERMEIMLQESRIKQEELLKRIETLEKLVQTEKKGHRA